MARKTKEDAEKTRQKILDAARKEFARRGVGRTSLDQIAKAAKMTRGAIYWHFESKADLFFAMREQICLPLHDAPDAAEPSAGTNPLDGVETFLVDLAHRMESDPKVGQTIEIVCTKCEYVDELEAVLGQMMARCTELIAHFTSAYELAGKRGLLRPGADAKALAMDTYLFLSGLIRLWASDKEGRILRGKAKPMVKAHMALRRK